MPEHEDVVHREANTAPARGSSSGKLDGMLIFLFGMVTGGLAALIVPVLWSAFLLPARPGAGEVLVTGVVTNKIESQERVLLRIESDSGPVLERFVERRMLVDILVDRGDTVTLSLPAYERVIEEAHLAAAVDTDSPTVAERDTTTPATEDSNESLEPRPD